MEKFHSQSGESIKNSTLPKMLDRRFKLEKKTSWKINPEVEELCYVYGADGRMVF